MKLTLSSAGNPDHGQNPFQPVFGSEDNYTTTVSSFVEATKECLAFIQRNNLGGGNWSGGEIFNNENNLIARVAYNGTIIEKESPYFSL